MPQEAMKMNDSDDMTNDNSDDNSDDTNNGAEMEQTSATHNEMPNLNTQQQDTGDEMPSHDTPAQDLTEQMPSADTEVPDQKMTMPGGEMAQATAPPTTSMTCHSGSCDQLFPVPPEESAEIAALLASPEQPNVYSSLLESRCGATDDSQPVAQYNGTLGVSIAFVNTHQRPAGQTQWNNDLAAKYSNPGNVSDVRWCSGTLISNDLFLTAGHCFDRSAGSWRLPKDNATGATLSSSQLALNQHINMNYQVDANGKLESAKSFPILELVEYRLGGLDYAIVRLGGNPGATFGTTGVSTTDAQQGNMLCIIGHPAGVPKRIEAGPTTDLHDDRIGYNDIDTLGGNSGSGVLRASDGRIVGVHTNGGCTSTDPDNNSSHNHGVRISSILAQSPTLQALTRSRSCSGPVVAWGPNRLDAFVIGTNSSLYHKWWNGASWGPSVTGYQYMGGKILGAPEVVTWAANRLDAFVIGTNSSLYHKWWNGASWGPSVTGYQYMGGKIIGQPKVVSWGPNRLDAFVIGTNAALYHKWWNGSSWGPSVTGYEYMGGKILGDPEVVSWGPKRLDAFVIGTNSALYHKWWNGSSWGPSVTGYEYMGGKILGQPKVVAWGPKRLDVFVTGTNSALYHKWWNGSSWGPSLTKYEYLGGKIISDPQVVAWGPNRLDVFAVGTNSALYHKWWNGSSWGPSKTGWQFLGGKIIGQVRVVSWAENRLDIFVLGTDSALYHKWWNGSSWGPSKTGWQKMGGTIINF
jgi:V8-like Glu-specific endopeptidase